LGREATGLPLWKRDLGRFGANVSARAILCAVRHWSKPLADDSGWTRWLSETLEHAQRFLDRPDPEVQAAYGRNLEAYLSSSGSQSWQQLRQNFDADRSQSGNPVALALYSVLHDDPSSWVDRVLRDTSMLVSRQRLEDTLRDELARWTLAAR
jgi:hypothetical protein